MSEEIADTKTGEYVYKVLECIRLKGLLWEPLWVQGG